MAFPFFDIVGKTHISDPEGCTSELRARQNMRMESMHIGIIISTTAKISLCMELLLSSDDSYLLFCILSQVR